MKEIIKQILEGNDVREILNSDNIREVILESEYKWVDIKSINDVHENDLLRKKNSNVTWIVWYVDKEDNIIQVYKNEGRPSSRMIRNFYGWQKRVIR